MRKLFLLTTIELLGYDTYDSFVVRAKNEEEARELASKSTGDEGSKVWTDSESSCCNELKTNGRSKIILGSFNAG